MMHTRMPEHVNDLVRRIAAAGAERHKFQPKLSRTINDLLEDGFIVPGHLTRLEAELRREAAEASFDNMPV